MSASLVGSEMCIRDRRKMYTDGAVAVPGFHELRYAAAGVAIGEDRPEDPDLEEGDFHLCTLGGLLGGRGRRAPLSGWPCGVGRSE
eukprot:11377314-Alexandrium_andersonii.AAC.1